MTAPPPAFATLLLAEFRERFLAIVRRELDEQIGDVIDERDALKRRVAHLEEDCRALRADVALLRPRPRFVGTFDKHGVKK